MKTNNDVICYGDQFQINAVDMLDGIGNIQAKSILYLIPNQNITQLKKTYRYGNNIVDQVNTLMKLSDQAIVMESDENNFDTQFVIE